ncbi:MAG: hypothetical protein HN625_05015 [Flavobacteriaceae bacterium]|jgi:hypothetical protein|nr:hypothetical protein [Nitrosomonadales bacterium]MBT7676137.1 hypothetical protein [Flavobacteriaceae bacterium]
MTFKKNKFKKFILVLAASLFSLAPYAAEKKVSEEDIDAAIDRINARINAIPTVEETFPKFTRIALDYSTIDGNIADQRAGDLFGAPFADGNSDADVVRLSTNIQLSENWSAGLSVSTVDGRSDIQQGPTNVVHSDSDATGYSASLRYQINEWLAAGSFIGFSNGDGNATDQNNPLGSGSFDFSGWGQGVYLSAVHMINEKWVYSVSPSYTHNKSKSKYANATNGEIITRGSLSMYHVDQNISYFFDNRKTRATAGYTHHIVAHENDTNSAPRSSSSGTGYLGGSYLISVDNGIELFGVASKDFGDHVYDDSHSFTVGIAHNFQ